MRDPEGLKNGEVLGDYQVLCKIGAGNMATVYEAMHVNLHRRVALKVIKRATLDDKDLAKTFLNEARAVSTIHHGGLIQVYEAGVTADDLHFLAMELVDGYTLEDILDAGEMLKPDVALEVMQGVAEALAYGWQKLELCHGDIKPANILIDGEGRVKLADFGLANTMWEKIELGEEVLLTPLYASPEAITGKADLFGSLPDIYSFGCTLYHLLVGHPPYNDDEPDKVCRMQVYDPEVQLPTHVPGVSQSVNLFINRMLKKDPLERPQSWKAVVNGLKSAPKKAEATSKRVFHLERPANLPTPAGRTVPVTTNNTFQDHKSYWIIGLVIVIFILSFLLMAIFHRQSKAERQTTVYYPISLSQISQPS